MSRRKAQRAPFGGRSPVRRKQGTIMITKAQDLIEQLVRSVRQPQGCAIVLRETEPTDGFDFDWVASAGIMPPKTMIAYESALIELKRQNRRVDWSGVVECEGKWRRIARYSSEVL